MTKLSPPPGQLVWDCWRHHAEMTPQREAIIHWSVGEPAWRWTWTQLLSTASAVARRLAQEGVRPGHVCALIIRHHRSFYPTYLALSACGALPAVLAYPNARLHPDKFRQGLEGMARRSGLDYVLTEQELAPVIEPLITSPGSTVKRLLFPLAWDEQRSLTGPLIDHPDAAGHEPCLLQHSSGTTGLQKAVVLSHRAVLEHVQRYGQALELTSEDKVVSWLPLYHDMGLIAAFYLPLTMGLPLVQLDPFQWVSAPILLLQTIAQEQGTLSWLPNFAYSLMADRIRAEDLDGLRLDSLRLLINCSEPVRAESQRKFYQRFAPLGLRQETLTACYAMAETTYAVTQTPPGQQARCLPVLRDELAQGRVKATASDSESSRVCVSSGFPIPGCELRIVDEQRASLPPERVGEIAIKSISLFDGYRNLPDKTAEVLQDGWYYSGDYGFVDQGEYFIIGRKKDIIIIAGNNLYPEDIEDAVSQVEGVLAGRVIAFGVEDEAAGTEQVWVIAETSWTEEAELKKLRLAILRAAMAIDVTIAKVLLVPSRWLIKSSSGKPSRSANRERVMTEQKQPHYQDK